METIIIVASL